MAKATLTKDIYLRLAYRFRGSAIMIRVGAGHPVCVQEDVGLEELRVPPLVPKAARRTLASRQLG